MAVTQQLIWFLWPTICICMRACLCVYVCRYVETHMQIHLYIHKKKYLSDSLENRKIGRQQNRRRLKPVLKIIASPRASTIKSTILRAEEPDQSRGKTAAVEKRETTTDREINGAGGKQQITPYSLSAELYRGIFWCILASQVF